MPISRRDLVKKFRSLGFIGPYSGGRHQFMIKGALKIRVPNPHKSGDISDSLLHTRYFDRLILAKRSGIRRNILPKFQLHSQDLPYRSVYCDSPVNPFSICSVQELVGYP